MGQSPLFYLKKFSYFAIINLIMKNLMTKILMIEDNVELAEILTEYLEQYEMSITTLMIHISGFLS